MVQIGLLDKKILERTVMGDSSREISETYGITEVEVVSTVKRLLAQGDVYTEIEERRMLVYKLKALLQRAETFLDYTDLRTAPKLLDSANNLIRSISEMQSRQTEITEAETRKLALQQATLIIDVVQASYQRARELLMTEYPEVNLGLIDDAFQQGVKEIAASHTT